MLADHMPISAAQSHRKIITLSADARVSECSHQYDCDLIYGLN